MDRYFLLKIFVLLSENKLSSWHRTKKLNRDYREIEGRVEYFHLIHYVVQLVVQVSSYTISLGSMM